MAKKPSRKSARKAPAKSAKPAKPAKSAKPAKRAAKAASPAAKPKVAKDAKAAKARAAAGRKKPAATKAAAAVPAREIKDRRQPETLRCLSQSVALTVDDLERSLAFYVDGLRFYVKDRWERDGRLLGVEMLAGACMIGLSQDDWAKGRDRTKGVGLRIYLETSQDVDTVASGLRRRGVPLRGPEDSPWGSRAIHVTDPDGYQLTLYRMRGG
jgi:uncharacterized glyoxalase superfamily protein PhnB